MGTAGDIAKAALDDLASGAGLLLALGWVNDRYAQFAAKAKLKQLRRIGTLQLPPLINTGAITTVRGSTSVTLDATAQTAFGTVTDLTGWFIRAQTGNAWYGIEDRVGATLRLSTPYAETAVTAGSYTALRRYHQLANDCRHIGTFVYPRRRRYFSLSPQGELDAREPHRQTVSDGPRFVEEAGFSASGTRQVELYPYNTDREVLYYAYWAVPPKLEHDDPLPVSVDDHMLKEGVLINLYRWEAAEAARSGKVEVAAYFRNESQARETRWERYLVEGVYSDMGDDDLTFVWQSARHDHLSEFLDITNAEEYVWNREP